MKKFLLIPLTAACFAPACLGQAPAASPILETPLILQQTPGFSQWTVDYTYAENPKPGKVSPAVRQYRKLAEQDPAVARAMTDPQFVRSLDPARLKHIVVTKTDDVRHEERVFEGDLKGELWGGVGFTVERKPTVPSLIVSLQNDRADNEFPEFKWISQENFTKIKTEDGRKVVVFEQQLNPIRIDYPGLAWGDTAPLDEAGLMPATAKIDAKTHFPVSVEVAGETRVYTMLPPPKKMLVIPPEFAAAAQAAKERLEAHTKALSPP